jgi:threonine/homoserine/homoserine lactone efflux protein
MGEELAGALPFTWATLGSFTVAALVIAVTPGPDTALTLRNTLLLGARAGFATACGSALGMFVHALAVVFGVAAIIAVSVTAFTAFKVVGALYLFWLGTLAFREALRRRDHAADADQDDAPVAPSPFVRMLQRWGPARLSTSSATQGVVSSVTNPKTAVFFLTFLPQYLDPTGNVLAEALVLTCLLSVVSVVWLGVYIWAIGLIAPFLRRPRVRRVQEGVLGTVFVSFGLRLATATQ